MTGIYRAVKVVRREDFDLEKVFEREFEGVQRYEKVSRDHPGLVDVLHVGRDTEANFYYYVMELADDQSGQGLDEIDPETYRAKTLFSDLQQNRSRDIEECISLGSMIAEALAHLHKSGLNHRDVKPANIIFINGEARLADIGLVAPPGQRTYVGTEGYLPPEGPGTSSSDLYALAMVLYEMHTGKDRLEFPDLPSTHELSTDVNRDRWRALNKAIFRAASPDPRKRFETGLAFSNALKKIPTGDQINTGAGESLKEKVLTYLPLEKIPLEKIPFEKVPRNAYIGIGVLLVIALSILSLGRSCRDRTVEPALIADSTPVVDEVTTEPVPEPEKPEVTIPILSRKVIKPKVKIDSIPGGATVVFNEEEIGRTPIPYREYKVGKLEFIFNKRGFHEKTETIEVKSGQTILVRAELKKDLGPISGEIWKNSGGLLQFFPGPNGKFVAPVTTYAYKAFLGSKSEPMAVAAKNGVVLVEDRDRQWEFCDWMTLQDQGAGYLRKSQYLAPSIPPANAPDDWFYCRIANAFNSIVFETEPAGAEVYDANKKVLTTPGWLKRRKGPYNLVIKKWGFEDRPVSGYLRDEILTLPKVKLERSRSLIFGSPWENSQGMTMVPVGRMMVACYETRVRDLDHYQMMSSNSAVFDAGFLQTLDEPIVNITRIDAETFCEWLTEKERADNLIEAWHQYRLPTDREWSQLAGLSFEKGRTPKAREREFSQQFPWGTQWPPQPKSGNFADKSGAGLFGKYIIKDYIDGFPRTAPVGSFNPTQNGLFDVGGNVWEWVSDSYDEESQNLGVVRGGGWDSYEKGVLVSSYRHAVPPTSRNEHFGFRYVLVDNRNKPIQ